MTIEKLVEQGEFLLEVYNRYASKLYSKISNPEFKLLLIVSYKKDDLEKLINYLKKYISIYNDAMERKDYVELFLTYLAIRRIYAEYESKIIERIMNLVKMYALYLASKNKN